MIFSPWTLDLDSAVCLYQGVIFCDEKFIANILLGLEPLTFRLSNEFLCNILAELRFNSDTDEFCQEQILCFAELNILKPNKKGCVNLFCL